MRALPVAIMLLLLAGMFHTRAQQPPVDPEIPKENRDNSQRVFLERADRLYTLRQDTFQILVGNVLFRKQGMFMYCDSAHFYPDNSMKAYGNVRMEQGDTLFVYADSLWYDNETELATLYAFPGKNVKLINRDVMLETPEFYYDMAIELGYYEEGGTLTDANNHLVSLFGEYSPSTKDANFYHDVVLTSLREGDTLTIYTDTLNYNTDTHLAMLTCFSRIVNKDGTIYTSDGIYNTETDKGELYDRSLVVMNRGTTLTGDTLFYDNLAGYGEAFGNMVMYDSVKQTTLMGDYGFYNELTDSVFVTGHALAMEHSRPDTLYLHGDTIRGFKVYLPEEQINDTLFMAEDSTHYMIIEPKVRFYRVDLQGICDSMTFIQMDSTMYMDKHPVVWSENRQIFGKEIQVLMNDSTVERVTLPYNGFSAEVIEDGYYDQLSGREMIAFMDNGELRHLDINGNVQAISFPMEDDSTYNKVVSLESSYLSADFKDQTLERMKVWPEVKTVITPLYLAKRSIFYLPQFRWLEILRPVDPEDVFNVSPEMIAYMEEPEEQVLRSADMKKTSKKEPKPGRRLIVKPLPVDSIADSLLTVPDTIAPDSSVINPIADADSLIMSPEIMEEGYAAPDREILNNDEEGREVPENEKSEPAFDDSAIPAEEPLPQNEE